MPTFKMGVISFGMMPIGKAPFGITTVMFLLYKCAILHIMPNGNYSVWHCAKWGTPFLMKVVILTAMNNFYGVS